MKITEAKHIHFTGIKGVGMTSLALCLQDLGVQISGSDTAEVFVTDEVLAKRGINWRVGFGKQNLVPRPDLVITTGAHGGLNNPEVLVAKNLGISVLTHAEALAELAKSKKTVTICGVGGKTTVASMIATLLDYAGVSPSFAIGVGNIFPLDTPGRFDQNGEYFICEADEFAISPGINNNPRFLLLFPKVIVVTNIEHDHPDIYPSIKDTKKVFRKFFEKVPKDGLLVACLDNPNACSVIRRLNVPTQTYGLNKKADWQIYDVGFKDEKVNFSLRNRNKNYENIYISVPGRYNILNATASFVVAVFLGIPESQIRQGLFNYKGARRRFEKIGEVKGVTVFDDYAHHPKEVSAVLSAAKERFVKRRLVAIFQPHTYSRTKALFVDFAKAFTKADMVGLMDIYASARETIDLSVDSEKLVQETKKYHPKVFYTGGVEQTLTWIKKFVKKGDVIITLGAGNIFHIHKKLLENLNG